MPTDLPLPAEGRVYASRCRVRLGDATPTGRVRLDALARFLQDVAEDDAADAGLAGAPGWVLRTTRLSVRSFPALGESLTLETYCSATAARWAERTTAVTGSRGGSALAVSVWVAVDPRTGAPARLDDRFYEVYGPSAGDRRASARLRLPPPPPDVAAGGRPWPLRAADFDVGGHVNNAISWAAVEDALNPLGPLGPGGHPPLLGEVEHHDAIGPAARPVLARTTSATSVDAWLLDGDRVLTAARVWRADGI